MKRRVVITGMGVISPLGDRPETMFDALLEGRSGVGPITSFDASAFPTRFAAEVRDFDLARYVRSPDRWKYAGATSQFAGAAAQQAMEESGLLNRDDWDRTRAGVYLGAGEGRQDHNAILLNAGQSYDPEKRCLDSVVYAPLALRRYHREREHEQELHTPPARVAAHFRLEGPNYNCMTACAAGSQAIGEAARLIRHGDAEIMVAGGSHSMVHPLGVVGFNLLTALSTRNDAPTKASRPFDLHRDGFVIGEGAGIVVLEELEHAIRRGAGIHAELTGYGSTADAYRLTDSHPDGRGAVACMDAALRDSGLPLDRIGYINAHGTSTQVNDKVETLAIKKTFGEHARRTPISSTKSMMGHLIGAAGAIELIVCILCLHREVLPPTINYEFPDPECDLDYIPNTAREQHIDHALSNSFGFGGQDVSLVVSRFRR